MTEESSQRTLLAGVAVALLLVTAGCANNVSPSTTASPTATAATTTTTTVPMSMEIIGMDATPEDATAYEQTLSEYAVVDVREVAGSISVMWYTNSPSVRLPGYDTPLENATHSQAQFAFFVADYLRLVENQSIEGSVVITAVHAGEPVAVWTVREAWARQVVSGRMSTRELYRKIIASRVAPGGDL